MRAYGLNPLALIALHAQKEWGALDAADRTANERGLVDGGRLLSAYVLSGRTVHAITDAVREDGTRACTTLLLVGQDSR
jgi:hypothetical protein